MIHAAPMNLRRGAISEGGQVGSYGCLRYRESLQFSEASKKAKAEGCGIHCAVCIRGERTVASRGGMLDL